MSGVLDENVVILRFDNSDFEKNTKESMSTLDKLKNSLNKNAGESLDNLGKSASKFNLDALGKSVDTINSRFSLMGIAGMAVINRLTNSAITAGKNLITALPKQAIQGGWQRALNLEQAQFLIEGLGFTWKNTAEQAAKGMKDVYTAVDNAVTGTRYALDEAAGVASQLLSSGVTDMEKLEQSLKAISGVASITNAEYSDIGRIFAQVKGQGRMMGDDLLQLQQRNIDATAAIKDYLNANKEVAKQALDNAIATGRQANKMKEIREHAELTQNDIRDMVSAGAIDFDILSGSFVKFFDQAEKANETYTGSLANLKSAINRIGESFMKIKLENFTKLFNALIPIFKRIKNFTDPLAESVGKLSNKFTNFLIEGIINPAGELMGAENLFHGFGDAAKEVANQVKGATDEMSDGSKKAGDSLSDTAKQLQAAKDIWYKGSYGTGEKRRNALEQLGISYKGTQAIINQFYRDGFKWDKIEKQLAEDSQAAADANDNLANSANNAGGAVENQTKQYPAIIGLIKGFVNILAAGKLALDGVKNILIVVGTSIKRLLAPGVKTAANGFASLTEHILNAAKKFNKFTESFRKDFNSGAWREKHAGLSKFIDAFKNGFNLVKDLVLGTAVAIKEFFLQFTQTEGFNALKEQLIDLIGVLKDLGGGVLEKITGQIEKLSSLGTSSNMSKVVTFFSGLANNLANMIAAIRRGENPLKGFIGIFGKVKEALSFDSLAKHGVSASVNALSAKNGTVAMVVNATDSIRKANIPKTFNSASESIFNFFDGLSDKVKKIDVKGTLMKVLEAFKNADWEGISKIAFRIGSLAAIFKTVHDMSRLVNAAVGTLGSISGFFGSLSGLVKAETGAIKARNFEMIALSVAILIGSIVALAAVPTDRLIPAMSGVLILVGMLVGVMTLMTSSKFDAAKVTAVGMSFAAMGASLMLLAMACKLLAGIDGEGLFKAGAAITVFMGMFILAGKMKGEIMASGAAFLAMAGAVNLLVIAVAAFAMMPWGAILKGATVVGMIMTELVVAARIAGMANPAGLLAMAAALDLLIPAIIIFSIMPAEQAFKGAVIACSILAMIGLASRTAAQGTAMTSLISMSLMVGTLSAALVVLSMIDGNRLAMAATALVTTMLSLSMAAKIASTSKAGLALLSLAIASISASIIALIKIDAKSAIAVANSLAVLAASLSVAFGIFSMIGVGGSLTGLGGLAIAIGGITAIIMALGAIRQIPGAEWLIKEGRKFAEQLGAAIGGFVGSIVGGFAAGATSGLAAMADNLSAFAEKIQPFIDMASKITPESAKGAKNLSSAIVELSKAELMDSLSSFSGFGDMASKMSELGEGFVEFSATVDKIPEDTADKAAKIAKIISTLAKSFSNIPKSNGLAQVFTGYSDIDLFVDGMLKFTKALGKNGMSKGLADLEISDDLLGENGKITKIVDVMNAMSKAAKKIPKSGGVQQAFTGNTTLEEFAEQLASFASNMPMIIASLSTTEIPDDFVGEGGKIDKICKIIGQLSKSAAEIPPSMGAKQAITGNTTISEFAFMLAAAIPGLSRFMSAAQNINLDDESLGKVRNVARAVKAMALASQELPETGGFKQVVFGGQEINTFASQLAAAIPGLQNFANGIKQVNIDKSILAKIPSISQAISAMAEVAKTLPKSGGVWQRLAGQKDIGNFGKQLGKLVESLGNDKIANAKINTGAIKSASTAINTIVPAVQAFKDAMPIPTGANLAKLGENAVSFVESLAGANTKGLASKASAISSASKKLAESASKGVSSSAKSADLSSSGGSIANSFLSGLKSKISSAASAGKSLATKVKSGASSVSLYSVGQDVGNGFVKGINSKQSAAYNSGRALGYKAKAGAKNAVNSNSPAKEFIKIGNYSGEGLVIGLKSYENKVYKAGYSMGAKSIEGSNDGIDSVIMDISDPVITPVLDLSEVDRGISTMDNAFSRNRAFGVNSTFQTNDYRTNKMMNDMVSALNKIKDTPNPMPNNITVNVDGTENPEAFAQRFVRQVQLEMRTG